jgi:hypothetical protein
MRLRVTPLAGDPYTVTTTQGDLVAWETYAHRAKLPVQVRIHRNGDGAPQADIEHFLLQTFHSFLAWRASHRGDANPPDRLEWLDGIEEITPQEEEEEITPTPAAP